MAAIFPHKRRTLESEFQGIFYEICVAKREREGATEIERERDINRIINKKRQCTNIIVEIWRKRNYVSITITNETNIINAFAMVLNMSVCAAQTIARIGLIHIKFMSLFIVFLRTNASTSHDIPLQCIVHCFMH